MKKKIKNSFEEEKRVVQLHKLVTEKVRERLCICIH